MTIEADELPPSTGMEEGGPAPDQKADELDAIAREFGWRPESEWKGEPPEGGFVSAAEYVRASREIAKSQKDNLKKELKALRQDTDKRIKRMEEMSAKQREKEAAAIHEEYDWWIRDAIKRGDDGKERALIKERDAKVKEAEAVGEEEDGETDLTEDDWIEQFQPAYPQLQKRFYGDGHAWILDDDADPDAMRTVLDFVDSGVPFAEALEKADRALRKAYPDQYEAADEDEGDDEPAPRKRVPVLASGAKAAGGKVSAASRLTPAQRAIGARFVEQKLFASLEEYAEERLKQG